MREVMRTNVDRAADRRAIGELGDSLRDDHRDRGPQGLYPVVDDDQAALGVVAAGDWSAPSETGAGAGDRPLADLAPRTRRRLPGRAAACRGLPHGPEQCDALPRHAARLARRLAGMIGFAICSRHACATSKRSGAASGYCACIGWSLPVRGA